MPTPLRYYTNMTEAEALNNLIEDAGLDLQEARLVKEKLHSISIEKATDMEQVIEAIEVIEDMGHAILCLHDRIDEAKYILGN